MLVGYFEMVLGSKSIIADIFAVFTPNNNKQQNLCSFLFILG